MPGILGDSLGFCIDTFLGNTTRNTSSAAMHNSICQDPGLNLLSGLLCGREDQPFLVGVIFRLFLPLLNSDTPCHHVLINLLGIKALDVVFDEIKSTFLDGSHCYCGVADDVQFSFMKQKLATQLTHLTDHACVLSQTLRRYQTREVNFLYIVFL